MALTNHISTELLKLFSNGRLSAAESDLILRHLAVCDLCLEMANAFWLAEPENQAAAFPAGAGPRLVKMLRQEIRRLKAGNL
jgi:hypothetical protein